MAEAFGLGYGDSGRMFTTFMLGYFITAPFFGYLGDRGSRKALIALGVFVWSLGTVLTGLAQGFVALLAFRAMVGVGEASYGSLSPGLISDVWPSAKRNMALTVFYIAIPVGSAAGYILGGEIAAHWGWRYAFYVAGAPGLLLALVLLPFKEPARGESEGAPVQTLLRRACLTCSGSSPMLITVLSSGVMWRIRSPSAPSRSGDRLSLRRCTACR